VISAGGEFAGLVAEEGAFDEGADGVAFVGVELVDGFEVVAEVVGDGAFFWVEEEHICADGEFGGEASEDVEGGLAGAGFVAAELADVDVDAVGEGGLGESAFASEGGEAVGERDPESWTPLLFVGLLSADAAPLGHRHTTAGAPAVDVACRTATA
jgi:hypothetical protein